MRGDYIHDAAGGNLPHNFKTIDNFDYATGTATSIKSTDLGLPTYQSASNLERLLNRYVNDVAGFNGGTWKNPKIDITADAIRGRTLDVYIPDRPMAPSQQLALNRVIQYGLTQGVTVHFIKTK
jgi:filamentous hemagglutinin